MTSDHSEAFEALERIFHEPNRLAIMSAVCGAEKGLSFKELKSMCNLTDGNLNRHLKVLDDAGAIRIDKRFVDAKPLTTVHLSNKGLKRFNEYLSALADVLKAAQRAMPVEARQTGTLPFGKTVRA
ncbi:MAG: transcriptional regulator [Verrucomicrobia bacterium]|nr:transcriptional regulator [Verrucomicrobiota bacterium]